jgi:D-alanine-D-alanine ligase
MLESVRLPFTGSDMISSALAMDKAQSNAIFKRIGLSVPKFQVIDGASAVRVKTPFVVKPVNGGSSVGTSIVHERAHAPRAIKRAFESADRVMIQEYVRGREFTCGVIEKGGRAISLMPTEIIPSTPFFDYHAKYQPGASREITPPNLAAAQVRKIQEMALKAHHALGCRGMSRSDFILSGGRFHILETNTIPGMTGTSLLPQGAKAVGIDFPQLLDLIIDSALHDKIDRSY